MVWAVLRKESLVSKKSEDIKKRRDEAVEGFDERTHLIQDWIKEKGKPKLRVKPFTNEATQESVAELIGVIEKALEISVQPPDFPLYNILRHLRSYDVNNPPTDEAGYDSEKFSLSISELNTALRHLKYGGPRNVLDYLVYHYRLKKFANKLDLPNYIPILHLESAMNCNLICQMCYQADERLIGDIKNQKVKLMPWNIFTKAVDDAAANGCRAVVFAGRGEPTLNPRFTDMLQHCHDAGMLDIKLNTNMTVMTEEMARRWLSMNAFLTVVFSVDAGDKKVYEEIRVGADFDKIMANIQMFNRIRREEYPDSPLRTRVNMVIFRPDQDIEQARKLWEPLVDEFSARNANSEQAGSSYQTNSDGSSPDVEPGKVCLAPFTRVYVWSDGTVNPCENDYLSWLRLGNLNTDSLHSIWIGSKMRALRHHMITGKKNCLKPCNGCSAK